MKVEVTVELEISLHKTSIADIKKGSRLAETIC